MKARKFVGENARELMKQARAELGEDAVILSNRAVPEGVEIMAMSGGDMDALIAAEPPSRPMTGTEAPAASSAPRAAAPAAGALAAHASPPAMARERPFRDFVLQSKVARENGSTAIPPRATAPLGSPFPLLSKAAPEPEAPADASRLMAELREMKGLLAQQFDSLAWNESLRRRPLRGVLLRELLAAGFGARLSRPITERLPDDFSEAQSRQWLMDVLARNLVCQGEPDIVDQGGVYALVGPTGVGKTTTAAKLAARCVMKFGAQRLGLITTDNYRIGAQDQLRIYGKILGVPVFVAQDVAELEHAIEAYSKKHLVLIDTIGMGQRDSRMAEQHALLNVPGIQRLLLLNATSQTETLDDVVRAYGGAPGATAPRGAVLTKIDEAIKLGGVLDVVLRNRLPLHFVCNGQRVPEDIHPANGRVLAHRALKSADDAGARLDAASLSLALESSGANLG